MGNPSCEIPNSRKDFFYEISIFILRNNLSGISWDWFSSSELFRTNFYPSESSQWISRDWFFTFGIMLMKFSTFGIILAGFHEMKLLHFEIILLSHRIYRDQTVKNQWITEVPSSDETELNDFGFQSYMFVTTINWNIILLGLLVITIAGPKLFNLPWWSAAEATTVNVIGIMVIFLLRPKVQPHDGWTMAGQNCRLSQMKPNITSRPTTAPPLL
jgi:hypothetical protein